MATPKYPLGATLRDTITGFQGVVTGRGEYLNGCVRYSLQPPALDNEGQPAKEGWFDEEQLELVRAGAAVAASHGGPMPAPARRSDPQR